MVGQTHAPQHAQQPPTQTDYCVRCHGLLLDVQMMDLYQVDTLWEQGKRCVNCGWITDTKIQNHTHFIHPPPKPRKPRSPKKRTTLVA